MGGTFRSLRYYNYRLYASGVFFTNIGTWLQRTAQDWLVLTELTNHNATAVGLVMACQFGPMLFLFPLTGIAADYFDRRRLMMVTQALMAALSIILGLLTVTELVQLWHVYVFALLFGCVTAFDTPVRQTFVVDLVGEKDLSNAVGLNSTSFNVGRMVGPAVAGGLILTIGTGGAFLINGVSFLGILLSLAFLRKSELFPRERVQRKKSGLADGFRYVAGRPDLRVIMLSTLLIGGFAMNFPIFISTMTASVFNQDAGSFGLLSSMIAIGTVAGALLAAKRSRPTIPLLLSGGSFLGVGIALGAIAPNVWFFGIFLVLMGLSILTFMNSSVSLTQLLTEPSMRGRVIALRVAIARGCTLIGAPVIGWVADRFGPRWGMGVGAATALASSLILLLYLVRYRGLRLQLSGRFGIGYCIDPEPVMDFSGKTGNTK